MPSPFTKLRLAQDKPVPYTPTLTPCTIRSGTPQGRPLHVQPKSVPVAYYAPGARAREVSADDKHRSVGVALE